MFTHHNLMDAEDDLCMWQIRNVEERNIKSKDLRASGASWTVCSWMMSWRLKSEFINRYFYPPKLYAESSNYTHRQVRAPKACQLKKRNSSILLPTDDESLNLFVQEELHHVLPTPLQHSRPSVSRLSLLDNSEWQVSHTAPPCLTKSNLVTFIFS